MRLSLWRGSVSREHRSVPFSDSIHEPAKEIPVIGEYDLCVLGGSCTGVFAAVRAARLGLSVAIVEKAGSFGGVAASSLVNIWHTSLDEVFKKQIFAGLTLEVIEALRQRGALTEEERSVSRYRFNSAELQIELDALVTSHGIAPWLHTAFCAPRIGKGLLKAVFVENKSGRGALRARFFIDATGDGDLCHRLGLETYPAPHRQPSTTCALFAGWDKVRSAEWREILGLHGHEFGLPEGFAWGCEVPDTRLFMMAGTRAYDDCAEGRGRTLAEIEGRRQVRAIRETLNRHVPGAALAIAALPAEIGVRETRHVRALRPVTGGELVHGARFEDAIANGSYPVDIHHDDKPGITFRRLDGTQEYHRPGHPVERGRWRPGTAENPTFYQIPYRALIPKGPFGNLLIAGRMIDADAVAYGALRVMVNLNQMGEAAGTAAALALQSGRPAAGIDPRRLRKALADGGSLIL